MGKKIVIINGNGNDYKPASHVSQTSIDKVVKDSYLTQRGLDNMQESSSDTVQRLHEFESNVTKQLAEFMAKKRYRKTDYDAGLKYR